MQGNQHFGRRSFTMVELLVVITVIAILAAIALQTIGGLVSQARHAATVATIEKIQGILNSRSQAFDRLLQRKGYLQGTVEWQNVMASSVGTTLHATLTKKLLEAKFFPQYAAEMQDFQLGATPTGQQTFLRSMPYLYPDLYQRDAQGNLTATPKTQLDLSGELIFAWINANVLGGTPVGQDQFSAAELTDIDGDGLQEISDAWGTPLRFYRWPTRLFRPTGTAGLIDATTATNLFVSLPVFSGNLQQDLARDPDDPLANCASIAGFEGSPFTPMIPVLGHTPQTYHVFLVVSAGPDKTFGMDKPDLIPPNGWGYLGSVVDPVALQDDIIHLQIRAGGK